MTAIADIDLNGSAEALRRRLVAVLRSAALAILTPAGFIAFLVHRAAFSGISGYFK